MDKEFAYWITFAHMPKITTKKKNEIVKTLTENNKSIIDFFKEPKVNLLNIYRLNLEEVEIIENSLTELPGNAFLAEELLEGGFKLIPVTSEFYPPLLKKNLDKNKLPVLLYTKGNLKILKEKSIAIVGSRKANEKALIFTDNIAKKASENYEVVVSGFAKGVDKQALDSALKYKGHSIIVLPQGIATFNLGFRKYYRQIVEGDVLVLSIFHPKAPWSVPFAMARNAIIYGLAEKIYVAQSEASGGTWSGAIEWLKKNRKIYVRQPEKNEKNANLLLINKGAIPVDIEGNIIQSDDKHQESQIIELLKKGGEYSPEEIILKLKLKWEKEKVISFLKNRDDIETIKKTKRSKEKFIYKKHLFY